MFTWTKTDTSEGEINELRRLASEAIRNQIRPPSEDLRLRNISISLTMLCNQGCEHCWVNAKHALANELTTAELCDVLHQARHLGAEHVKITGGEPFTRPDILDVLRQALELGYRVSVETNALLIRTTHLRQLMNYRDQLQFYVSLDGAKPETHDNFRHSPGSYKKTLMTLRKLKRLGFKFSVHTVANKTNVGEISRLYELVCQLGAQQHKVILTIHRMGRGKNVQDNSLEVGDIIWLLNNFEKTDFWDYRWRVDNEAQTRLMVTLPPAFQPLDNLNSVTCGWGNDFCSILADGNVAMCHGSYEHSMAIADNIRGSSLNEIWRNSEFFQRARSADAHLKGICGNCVAAPACRGLCRTSAIAEYDDFLAPYPLCQEMYERGLFPMHMMVDPDKDCSYTLTSPRKNGESPVSHLILVSDVMESY